LAKRNCNILRERKDSNHIERCIKKVRDDSAKKRRAFWGQSGDVPLTKTAILKGFKAALARIEIPEAEKVRRVLLFHSHRHSLNTWLRGKVPDEQLRRVTGHKTLAILDNYDHPAPEQLKDVAAVQEKLFALNDQQEDIKNEI
jgi:integrase